ncbi:MAG: SGNH/GDSL hydrolase family protein [Lachnospiraceae bacterium]|nr:SGNH/GDSL hydrolase family protein [Lachnospiraceae bacterium]
MKKRIRNIAIILVALLIALEGGLQIFVQIEMEKREDAPGNAAEYDISNLEKNLDHSLNGKTIIFLGSSVTDGAAAEQQSFVELFEYRDGVQAIKEAKSGTTLVNQTSIPSFLAFGNGKSYVRRLKELNIDEKVDCVVCQLSTNDATMKKDLGQISESKELKDFDTSTITGAMEYVIAYSEQTWNCPVVFYTGAYYSNKEYEKMVQQLYALQDKWSIGIIDLYSDKVFNDIDQESYELYMYDEIHPTKAGYEEWWMPIMEKQLIEFLCK